MKIAAIDLDGTLLHSDSNMSDFSKKMIEKAAEQDILVIPTSGRSYRSIMSKIGDVKGIRYTIGANGSVITDCSDEKIILNKKIPTETCLAIYHHIKDRGGFYCGYSGNDSYIETGSDKILLSTKMNKAMCIDLLATDVRVPDLGRMMENGEISFGKLYFSFIDPREITACVDWLGQFDDITYGYSTPYTVEVFAKDCNKDLAFDYLRQCLGVSREDTIAVGDSENDLSMVRYARFGAAVANGMNILKEHADLVIPSNDEDGPAHLLEKIMLEPDFTEKNSMNKAMK